MIENLLFFIEQNNQWAAFIVLIVALLESVAILGLFVPGWVLLVGVGTLIGADVLSFYPIAIAAYFGAVIGEYLSFLCGYYYHEKILSWAVIAKHQKLIDSSREFFNRYGISGVFVGRFFGPTRAIVPLIAGISEMKQQTFFWVNIISGIFWALIYLIPGILIGAAFSLEKSIGSHLILILLLIVVSIIIAVNFTKDYWKNKQQKVKPKLALLKCILSWVIVITMLNVFYSTSYWKLFTQILNVVWSKF